LETVHNNLRASQSRAKLIERIAEVPDLPSEQIPAFRKFTDAQGRIFLRTINDWLESRRAKTDPERDRAVHAGVHVHSYLGMHPTGMQGGRGRSNRVRLSQPLSATPFAESSPHSSSAAPAGNKHAWVSCTPRVTCGSAR